MCNQPFAPSLEYQTFELVQGYAKIYPHKVTYIRYNRPSLQRVPGFEARSETRRHPELNSSSNLDTLRRTKRVIHDLVISNNFDLFATFTFDGTKTDRFNIEECKKKMAKWIHNQKDKNGQFKILIVPEYHKNGAIHFHALLSGYTGQLVPSCLDSNRGNYCKLKHKHRPIKQNGKTIYNIKSYRLGFTNVSKIENIEKTGAYVRKYITKSMPLFKGRKRYWCSQGLVRPVTIRNPDAAFLSAGNFVEKYQAENLTILESQGTLPVPTKDILKGWIWQTPSVYWRLAQLTMFSNRSKSLSAPLPLNQHRKTLHPTKSPTTNLSSILKTGTNLHSPAYLPNLNRRFTTLV